MFPFPEIHHRRSELLQPKYENMVLHKTEGQGASAVTRNDGENENKIKNDYTVLVFDSPKCDDVEDKNIQNLII